MNPTVILLPTQPADEPFAYRVYASTRTEEIAAVGWNPEQAEAFLSMQFSARQRSYRDQFPTATNSVICRGATAVGTLIVDRGRTDILLIDIALLPEFRGQGIGSELMQALLAEAAGASLPLRLTARTGSRAAAWYGRLGFAPIQGDEVNVRMEWIPPTNRTPLANGK